MSDHIKDFHSWLTVPTSDQYLDKYLRTIELCRYII